MRDASCGGGGSGGEKNFTALDEPIWTWKERKCSGQVPGGRNSMSCVISKNKMVIFGGADLHGPLNHLYSLDLGTFVWGKMETSGDVPIAREMHSAVLLDENSMLVHGGRSVEGLLHDAVLLDLSESFSLWSDNRQVPNFKPF